MKLAGAQAAQFLAHPSALAPGFLIYGQDPIRVAMKRKQAISAIIGPQGEAEMRLTRLSAAELRKDPALLQDGLKAQGFFPGDRVVFVEDASDGLSDTIASALKSWVSGDAQIIVTAGALAAKSALRKLFEVHPATPAIALYDDPPTQAEIEAELRRAGLDQIAPEAMRDLVTLSKSLDPGDFRQTVEKIGLYKWQDQNPLTPEDVANCAPTTIDAELDDVIHAAAEGNRARLAVLMRRVEGQGVSPVTLAIRTLQHFRALHAAASDPSGPAMGIGKIRPPVFGPRRDRMVKQAQSLGLRNLEQSLSFIIETDMQLRSSSKAPTMALVERMLLRLSWLVTARR